MADDIVTRLRDTTITNWDGDEVTDPLCEEAADEIERLREINRNLHTECDRMNAERRA